MKNEYGVWLSFPENEPENDERVLIIRKNVPNFWEVAVYNKDYECWDDSDGDDYMYDLDSVEKFMKIKI